MGSVRISGTEGYAEAAEALLKTRLPFEDLHRPILHLILSTPARILDIGSGPGHDAAAFAAMGHRVVAVEPTEQLRLPAMALHPSPLTEWVDDSLPHLRFVVESGDTFDLVMLNAVWMHLDEWQRQTAMPVVASVLTARGTLIMPLRPGPVPSGRRMFEERRGGQKSSQESLGCPLESIDGLTLARPRTVRRTEPYHA